MTIYVYTSIFVIEYRFLFEYGKNDFADVSRNFVRFKSENNFRPSNYVRFKLVTRTSINSLQHSIMHSSCSNVLYNYFDGPTKLFSDLNLIKFLDTQQQNHSFHEKK